MYNLNKRWDAIVTQQALVDERKRIYTLARDYETEHYGYTATAHTLALWHDYEQANYDLAVMRAEYDQMQRDMLALAEGERQWPNWSEDVECDDCGEYAGRHDMSVEH
jgi:hypothetical protein